MASNPFQSLLSQGISLLHVTENLKGFPDHGFQSLLSQGISLLAARLRGGIAKALECFNPFLVRASVYCEGVAPLL